MVRREHFVNDEDNVNAGYIGASGESVRLMLEFFFPFGRPVKETIERLEEHLRTYPMGTAKEWLDRKKEQGQ